MNREEWLQTGEEAMKLTMNDHDCCLRCCADERATAEEREFLSYMASLAAARKPVSQAEWLRMQALTGGALSTVTPIQDRPKPLPRR